jgi:hypothetical protein
MELACDVHSILLYVDACDTGFGLWLDIESVHRAEGMAYGAFVHPNRVMGVQPCKNKGCMQGRPTARIL